MKILLLNRNLGKWAYGGMETQAELLASLLIRRGHNVVIGCSVEGTVTGKTSDFPLPAKKIMIVNSIDLFSIIRLTRILKQGRVDLVLVNHGRDYWPAAIAASMSGTRIVFVRHMWGALKRGTCYMINRFVDKVVAVSRDVADRLTTCGLEPARIEVIHNGINLEVFDPDIADRNAVRMEFGIDADSPLVGFVGKLHAGKGVYYLLDAITQLSGMYPLLKAVFAGDGPERQRLQQEAADRGLADRIILTGERKDITNIYSAMDVCVLPSADGEAFGMVLIEAMAMKRPVIGTTVGGITEIIRHEQNGLLVPQRDQAAIAAAVRRYLEEPLFRQRMAAEGRLTVERTFSDSAMCDRYEQLFQKVIAGS